MTRAFVVAARRTAVVPRGLSLAGYALHDLAAPVIRACLADAGLPIEKVDHVIFGNALGAGGNPARVASLAASLPETVSGLSLDSQCCSGLDAVLMAQAMIAAGQAEVVVAGGAESYSQRPIRMRPAEDGDPPEAYDQPPFTPWPDRDPDMAAAAAALAREYGISRKEQDDWAIASHRKAFTAQADLAGEIVPLGQAARDRFARHLTPALCARAPVISGTVTAANTAVEADAAAIVLVVAEGVFDDLNLPALEILGGAATGGAPEMPGVAPVAAIAKTLGRLGLRPADFAQAEIMEAYAAQAIVCAADSGIDPGIVNPKGGALARGHPVGASGAVLTVRLFHDLAGTDGTGLAAIAAAGGLGTALVVTGRG